MLDCVQVVREGSRRVLGLRPFDVQLIGGMILHNGEIAEMRTGEGKTLVAVLPAYLNALAGKGVQVTPLHRRMPMGRMYILHGPGLRASCCKLYSLCTLSTSIAANPRAIPLRLSHLRSSLAHLQSPLLLPVLCNPLLAMLTLSSSACLDYESRRDIVC